MEIVHSSRFRACQDRHQTIPDVVFDCVTQQVEHHLFDLIAVGFHLAKIRRDFESESDMRLGRLGTHDFDTFFQ